MYTFPSAVNPGAAYTPMPFQRVAQPSTPRATFVADPWGGATVARMEIRGTDDTSQYGSGVRCENQDFKRWTQGQVCAYAWSLGFGDGTKGELFAAGDQWTTMGQLHYAEPPAVTGSPIFQLFARSYNGDKALRFAVRPDPASTGNTEHLVVDPVPLGHACFFGAEVVAGVSVKFWWSVDSPYDYKAAPAITQTLKPLPSGGYAFGPLLGVYRDKAGPPSTVLYVRRFALADNIAQAVADAAWSAVQPPQPVDPYAAVRADLATARDEADFYKKGSPHIYNSTIALADAMDELLKLNP